MASPSGADEATIGELLVAGWRASIGSRRRLGVALATAIALFVLLAALPLFVGRLLDTALSGSNSQQAIEEYLTRRRELVVLNGRLLGDLQDSDSDLPLRQIDRGMDLGVLSALAQGSGPLLDALFEHLDRFTLDADLDLNVRRQLDDATGVEREVLATITSDGSIDRSELEELVDPFLSSSGAVARLGVFDRLVTTIALEKTLIERRDTAADRTLRTEVTWFAAAIAVAIVLRQVTVRLALDVTQASGQRLRQRVFAQVHDTAAVDSGFLGRPSMVSRCTAYVDRVEAAWRSVLVTGIPAVASLVLSVTLLWWADLGTGLVITVTVVLLEAIRRRRSPRWSAQARDRLDRGTDLTDLTDLAVSHRRSVWARHDQGAVRTRFAQLAELLSGRARRVELNSLNQEVAAFGVGQLGLVVVVAAIGLARSDIGIAAATASVLYVGRVADALARLPGILADLAEASPYQRRLGVLLTTPKRRPEPEICLPAPTISDPAEATVSVTDLSVAPPGPAVPLSQCSLRADASAWTIVVGPPGSGASTLTGVLAGLDAVPVATVHIATADIARWSTQDLQRMVGVVPATPMPVTGTWRDQILPTSGADRDDDGSLGLDRVVALMGLDDALATLDKGLDTEIDTRNHPLSIETRARLAGAAVLAGSAPVVVIEDPTSGLDHDVALAWWQAMRTGLAGRVVIATTARRDIIRGRDQVVVMEAGRIIERGHRGDLIAANGAFARWWSLETGTELAPVDLRRVPGLAALDDAAISALSARLVTERYGEGEVIVAAGAPLDRVMLVADGLVELVDTSATVERRIALVRPGNQIGEVRTDGAAPAAYTARALEATVVRSLHRLAISDGVAGMLERPRDQRIVYAWLVRHGESSRDILESTSGPQIDAEHLSDALDALIADGSVIATGSTAPSTGEVRYRVAGAQRRRRGSGLLDQLLTSDDAGGREGGGSRPEPPSSRG